MRGWRTLLALALIASMPPPHLAAQTTYTNDLANSQELWDITFNWDPNGIPGFQVSQGTNSLGTSNDAVIVNFLTTTSNTTQTADLDFFGEDYVFKSLTIFETTNFNSNSDGNFVNTGGFSGDYSSTQTLERVEYLTGGRQIDIYPEVTLRDKADGKAFEIFMGGNSLDLGGGLVGSDGLIISNNQTLYIRGFEAMKYGSDPTNGLTFTGSSGSSKYFYFNAVSNTTYNIPNLTIRHDGNQNYVFGQNGWETNATFTNLTTVNVQNLAFNTNATRFHIGGDSLGDGTPTVTVNVNSLVDFSVASNAANRAIQLASLYGGIVNFNSNIVINQAFDGSFRTLTWNGNGVARINADIIQTNGSPISLTNIIDGARSLVVDVNAESRLGTGNVDLRIGSVLRMSYNVFSNSYPGSTIRYGDGNNNANTFLDFNAPQTGFYDPISNNTAIGLVVRSFNGISGNLTGANFTNASGAYANNTISFQTNAILGEKATALPTRAQLGGAILYQGIQNAGGTYTNIGDDGATSIFKGVAISALTPLGDGELGILDSASINNVENTFSSGFYGDLTARPGQDLEVLIPGDVFFTANNFYSNATFNATTGVAYFRGPGRAIFQRRISTDAWGGTVTNLIRVGLNGVVGPDNPLGIQSQNSVIVELTSADALPATKTLTVRDGQVLINGGDVLGISNNATNTVLVVGAGGSMIPGANPVSFNRGKMVFEEDGAIYTSGGANTWTWNTSFTNVLTAMGFSPESLLIINDGSTGGNNRDLSNPFYGHALTNMNIIFNDDNMRTAIVETASSFALGEGKYLTHARNSNGNFDRLITISGSTTSDVPITAAAGVTQVQFIANQNLGTYQTFDIKAQVDLPTTDLIVGNSNKFITVVDDQTTRSNFYGGGTLRIDGTSNTFRNIRVASGALLFHDNTNDQTRISGNLIFDPVSAGNTNPTFHGVFGGDFQVASNIVINESRALVSGATSNTVLFTIDARGEDFNAGGAITNGDGRGLMERLLNGTLAGGSDGVVVNDYARFEVLANRTNGWVYNIAQKITIDNTGPNYNGGERNLDFRAENGLAGVTNSSGIVTFNVPNIVMRNGSFLRINEANNSPVRAGLILEGTNFIGEGSGAGANSDDFDLLNVRSSVAGASRLLYVGNTNLPTGPDPDTSFQANLYGVGSTDVTFFVFNGTLNSVVTNGGDIQGNVIVRSGSIFAVLGGTDSFLGLAGNGNVQGSVQVGGTLSPGLLSLAPGTLADAGNVLFTSNSILAFDLAGSNTVTGANINDYLAITGAGNLTLDGKLNVNPLSSFAGRGTNTFWTLITYTGTLTSNGLDIGSMPTLDPGLAWAIDYSLAGNIRLGIVIPEPTTWILIGIGLGIIGIASRRRR